MAHHKTNRALVILFTFQLYIVALNANSQTFGPLIRDRSIRDRQQTSEEDLNANIERIFQKDLKTIVTPRDHHTHEVQPSPTELVSRAHTGGTFRPRQPIGENEQQPELKVYRGPDGQLVPKFSDPPPMLATAPEPSPMLATAPEPSPNYDQISGSIVLKFGADSKPMPGSYPDDYPHNIVKNILSSHEGIYEDFFEDNIKREPLATRTNSETDMYLCSSTSHNLYPTFNPATNRHIVNVEGFYQPVISDICNHVGSTCSKVTTTRNYELKCMQTYRNYKLFAVPVASNNSSVTKKLDLIDVRFPACCKCAQVSKSP